MAAFTDSYNNIVRAVKNYHAQSVAGGLGTGGQLAVQGDGDNGTPVPSKKKTAKRPSPQ
ncbi:hypothetical protein [Collimonas pratensis]|uniref:Peptidoglycan-binding 1 domain protein n=1 Tax=Collimonas pratensis TaxID=279113 RepID=A0ABM5Z9Q9_9BURK|nr:peptidoglycan-binding 1 domain protein [Collimonas pratensis]